MANEYEIFEFLEADYAETKLRKKLRRRRLREECDPFNVDEAEFVKRYRLTKELARHLCDELRPMMTRATKSTDISVETKVLTALSFYASGSFQRPTGSREGHFMAQQTVSTVIAQVTSCLNSQEMKQKHIHFPANEQERNKIKAEFYNKFKIPGVLGCIDSTHVSIVRPVLHEERFYCSKRYYTLNVQLVCDANMQIMSVDASHGGASHDSFIWTNHPLQSHLEELSNTENIWFLGGSKYPLSKTTMTPILDAAPDTPEEYYTNLHIRARNIIDHTIGHLKARFRCLLAHKVLHYTPEVAASIVNACVILHNICNRANAPVQQLSSKEVYLEALLQHNAEAVEHPQSSSILLEQGLATRNALVQELWGKSAFIAL